MNQYVAVSYLLMTLVSTLVLSHFLLGFCEVKARVSKCKPFFSVHKLGVMVPGNRSGERGKLGMSSAWLPCENVVFCEECVRKNQALYVHVSHTTRCRAILDQVGSRIR